MKDARRVPGSPDFGTLLRRFRLAAKLSQEALAERARLSTNGISALERGYRRRPQPETLALLAGALHLDADQRQAFEEAGARFQLLGRKAPIATGPWPDSLVTSLPIALTSFVGRETELEEVIALMRDHRMVTLTGAGGVGKTQTALHVGAALTDADDDGVCFIELAPIGDPSLLVATISSTLGVRDVSKSSPLETLVAYLRDKVLLLILDNCEHVITQAAIVTNKLLNTCPRVRILATSREPLRVAGEQSYRLPSLSVPPPEATPPNAAASNEFGAIALFVDRARAADHRFTLTDGNVLIVAEICRRLDGIPLAIELAAARVNLLSLEAIAEKLGDCFRILTGGVRTALPRQQTMRATIDWSYNLLAASEQQVFERLAVFAGGCTLGAAAVVCESEKASEETVQHLLSSLVDKSLIVVDIEGRESRYRLLEVFRQYARQKLAARDEEDVACERHARLFLECAEQLDAQYYTEPNFIWSERARGELDNCRTALEWCLSAHRNVLLGQSLAGELAVVWFLLASGEGRRWIALALDLVNDRTPAQVLAKMYYADALVAQSLDEGERQLLSSQKALALYQDIGDDRGIALSKGRAGHALVRMGRAAEAEPMLHEVLEQMRRLNARKELAYVLRVVAFACNINGNFEAARRHIAEAIAIFTELGEDHSAARSTAIDFADVELHSGNAELAFQHASGALPALCAFSDVGARADALNIMSACLISLADYYAAEAHARESLLLSTELHAPTYAWRSLQRLAVILALRPENSSQVGYESYVRAAHLFGFIDARLAALGSPRVLNDQLEYERTLPHLREALGSDKLTILMNAGAAMSEQQAIDEASAHIRDCTQLPSS